jgi:hypothetical protein
MQVPAEPTPEEVARKRAAQEVRLSHQVRRLLRYAATLDRAKLEGLFVGRTIFAFERGRHLLAMERILEAEAHRSEIQKAFLRGRQEVMAEMIAEQRADIESKSMARQKSARVAADALHSAPGGSRSKRDEIRKAWATGKYTNRDRCAEEEGPSLGMSFSAARKALRNTPDPT